MYQRKKERGFTIIELLVVIVIVAILAVLVVVGYGSIRQRADAMRALSIVDAYEKMFRLYYSDYQQFPPVVNDGAYGTGEVCLGQVSDFPAVSGTFNSGDCIYNSNDGYRVAAYQPFINLVTAYTGSFPQARIPDTPLGVETWRGFRYTAFYGYKMIRIEWIIPGAHEDWCGRANGSDIWWGSTWCTLQIDMR